MNLDCISAVGLVVLYWLSVVFQSSNLGISLISLIYNGWGTLSVHIKPPVGDMDIPYGG